MKKAIRFLTLALCMALVFGSFSFSATAAVSKYDSAISVMNREKGVFMSVTSVVDGESTTLEYIYDNKLGATLRLGERSSDSVYFLDVAEPEPSVVVYMNDVAPQPEDWYVFDSTTWEFAIYYDLVAEFAFLRESFDDSCFSISGSVLTVKAEYANEVAHSFFGDYSYDIGDGVGMYDDYSNVKIYISGGTISKVTADNKYGSIGDANAVESKFTAEFKFGSFALPEYRTFETLYPISEPTLFTPGMSSHIMNSDGSIIYRFIPTETTTVRFFSSDIQNDCDPIVDIMVPYDDTSGFGKVVETFDDTGLLDANFSGAYTFHANQIYYIFFHTYEENGIFKFNTEEILFQGSDLTDDGRINAADASVVLRYDVGLYAFSDEQLLAADANKDGKVNAADASTFLRYDIGLIRKAE